MTDARTKPPVPAKPEPGALPQAPEETWGRGARPTAEIVEFLPDARALEERPIPRAARGTFYVVVGLLIAAILWAAIARVDRIVVAPGRLALDVPKLVVQPLETSIIRSLDVQVGDHVRKGQVLAHLDPTFSESSRVATEERVRAFRAEEARLVAEIGQKAFVADPRLPEYATQLTLHENRQREYRARLDAFDAAAAELAASEKTGTDAQIGLAKRIKVAREIVQMREELLAKQAGSKLNLLQARADLASLEADERARQNTIEEIRTKIAANLADRNSFMSTWNREITDRLSEVRNQLSTSEQQAISAGRRADLSELVAQQDAVVVEVAQRSVGSVIREAEPLITLVPANQPLEAEVEISTRDIGWVREGAPVRVKFETLPYQQHGTAEGVLRVVTKDAVVVGQEGSQRSVYRAKVRLEDLKLRNMPKGFTFLPGMQVTSEIRVGTRSVLSYVLNPLTRAMDESLREP